MDEDRSRYFPAGSLDPLPDLHRGQAEQFALFLQGLEERPLYPALPDQPLVIRLLCLPTCSPACSVRVSVQGLSWLLVAKGMDGEAGFEVGRLLRRTNRVLSAPESAQVADLWQYLCFWSLAGHGEDDVFDGTTYVLEAAQHGRYHVAQRDDPEWGDPFGEFADLLLRLAALASR